MCFNSIHCVISFFIMNFSNLSFFLSFSLLVWLRVYQFCLKNQLFVLSSFSIVSFVSISLISALVLIISCLPPLLVLICCSFNRALRCNVWLYICLLFILLLNELNAMNFPLHITFIASKRLWYIASVFSFTCKNFF